MSKKQTAVEWFYDILTNRYWDYMTYEEQDEIYQKAKQMEKEQIMKAYSNGSNDRLKNRINDQYYNETYESNT